MTMSMFDVGVATSSGEWGSNQIAQWLAGQDDHTVIALAYLECVGGLKRYSVCCLPDTKQNYGMRLDYCWFAMVESNETPVPFPDWLAFERESAGLVRAAARVELRRRKVQNICFCNY